MALWPAWLAAQTVPEVQLQLQTGQQIYEAACIGCHGPHGEGMPKTTVGFEAPKTFPDFTKCDQTAKEFNRDYKAAIRDGGPARGFSPIMPSFRDALTPQQMDLVIQTLRNFCQDRKPWPRGELNFPRALVTEKAFPEDEAVLTTGINAQGAPGLTHEFAFEKRFGVKNQLEVAVPFSFMHQDTGGLFGGIGDIAVGMKRVIFSSLRAGNILTLQGEVALPTGNRERGFGTGVTTFGTFASFDQRLPGNSFVQFQGGAHLPAHTDRVPQSVFWRTAVGKSYSYQGLGRMWTPIMEWVADRDLDHGARTNWDVVPQFQVTLSRRQHIRADLGLRIPATNTAGRPIQVMLYVLWDTADGGLFEGWR